MGKYVHTITDRIEIEHNNKQLSFGQANTIAMNSDNEKERLEVFELLTSTLHKEKEIFATVLNQIGDCVMQRVMK